MILIVFALVCGNAFISVSAQAQQCSSTYEMIVRLDPPPLGSYSVLNAPFGLKVPKENIKSVVYSPDNRLVLAMERHFYEGGPLDFVLGAMDRRGRITWEKNHSLPDLQEIIKIMRHKDGYIVFANKHKDKKIPEEVWIGFFGEKGELKKEKVIKDSRFNLNIHDAVFDEKTSRYILAISAGSRDIGDTDNAVIYRLDEEGNVISQNGYAPGLQNRILSLALVSEDRLLGVGYIRTADGRKAGWVVLLDKDGSLMWQRQYARGLMASLNTGGEFVDNHVVVGGEAHPAGNGSRAAWIMALDITNGNIAWQRYYRGAITFKIVKIITHKDGLISVLIAGLAGKKDEEDPHVRLLTLTPRGTFFSNNTFLNGKSAAGHDMIIGTNGERIIVGNSEIYHRPKDFKEGDEIDPEDYSVDGWVLSAVANDPYDDPCAEPVRFIP